MIQAHIPHKETTTKHVYTCVCIPSSSQTNNITIVEITLDENISSVTVTSEVSHWRYVNLGASFLNALLGGPVVSLHI